MRECSGRCPAPVAFAVQRDRTDVVVVAPRDGLGSVNCIKGEIHNIIASLRLGWAAHIAFLSDFKALHEQLCEVDRLPPVLPRCRVLDVRRAAAGGNIRKLTQRVPCIRFRRRHRSARSIHLCTSSRSWLLSSPNRRAVWIPRS